MKTIDTCGQQHYSPLIPAIKAMCEAGKGEKLEIIMDDAAAFNDMKEYLSEQQIGFREIYDGERMTLQFLIPLQTGFLLPRKKWNCVVGTNWM